MRSTSRANPSVVDVCVAVFLAMAGLPEAIHGSGWQIGVALDVALAVPLIWRRRSPIVAFGAVAAVTTAAWVIGPHTQFGIHRLTAYHLVADVALLIAFYTVAAEETRQRTIAAAAVLEFALFTATLRWVGVRNGPVLFILLSGTAAAAAVSGDLRRTRRAYLATLEQRAATLEIERDQQARLAGAAERARIARDMHDIVAHNLSVMIALADGASFAVGNDPAEAGEAMAQVAATGRQALSEMRRLLGVLRDEDRPASLGPQPGIGDLDTLLGQVRLTGLHAALVTEGPVTDLPLGLQLAVYRIVQESLTNTLKHAVDAQHTTVRLRLRDQRLDVDVVDDGRPATGAHAPGHGVAGMRERVALYGGTIETGPVDPTGWRVAARFDLRTRELVS